jgi:magnesium-transporting ATPase (P-type)
VLFVVVVLLGLWRSLPLSDVLMVAISQMVSMVPEGLPVAMTIALAVGMQRMAARGAIIRRLSAVETLGSTTVICSDKTGTLTRNEMTAVALWLPDVAARSRHHVAGSGYAPRRRLHRRTAAPLRDDTALQALLQRRVLCNDALLQPPTTRPAWTCWATRPKARCACWRPRPGSGRRAARRGPRAKPSCPSTPTTS